MNLPDLSIPPLPARIDAPPGSSRALLLLRLGRPFLAVCPGEEEARRLHADLAFFAAALGAPGPVLLPPREERIAAERLAALERIAAGDAAAVVTDGETVGAPVWSPGRLRVAAVVVRAGDELDEGFLAELLAGMGYRRVRIAAAPGEFAVRSGRIDVFPAAAELPVRIEFGGGKTEALRAFDIGTQRSFRDLAAVSLLPANEPEEGPTLFAALPGRVVVADGEPAPGAAGLPPPDLILAEPGTGTVPAAAGALSGIEGLGLTARERGRAGEGIGVLGPRLAALSRDRRVVVAAETLGEAERLRDLLAGTGVAAEILDPAALPRCSGPIAIVKGRLSRGFVEGASRLVVVTSAELFGPRPPSRPPRPSRVSTLIASLDELEPGDHVVHVDHGIGRFAGVERAGGGEGDADFLRLEYAGGASLLLPVERIDLLRRYQAAGEGSPRLDTIGGTAWGTARSRAAAKVREMAGELLRLAAARETASGVAFPPDAEAHREFADAFPWEETPDQRAAIDEVRRDMEAPRPMDRLLCGDVGYGKTEVAMRAAFKAVAARRQVAVIAPTTVLAEQHADVFAARFAPFGVRVDALTRFTPPGEEGAVLARIASGESGIVIGTHRLLAADVRFADLGLLVVDEEQRFGVTHKERIRQLREGVDVLTLTATPIPRTLHQALAGLRGISTLETPPEERLAVKTVVAPFGAAVIREALEREFARGGQAFFVHNRIESIARVGVFLQGLLPGRRIGIAHARLPATALEDVMHRFHAGEVDLLLATAIVGAGLDVPRANTILVDRADRFGLADLYQLKGRVGRADRRAYAYLLVPHESRITEEARRRLDALTELSYLGAGFRLALRDLEIRGAGDLLGPEQSGHIAAVGFDLYREMLEGAVAELRGTAPPPRAEPVLELRVEARLPADWVDDPALRLALLRRISGSRDAGAVADLRRELRDRFGPPPLAAARLLDLAALRAACRAAGVARVVETGDRRYRVVFGKEMAPSARALREFESAVPGRFEPLAGETGFDIDLGKRSFEEIARMLVAALHRLAA